MHRPSAEKEWQQPARVVLPMVPGRPARETRSDDPGLVLISRRPPQQKFSSFEEYMAAHGGATAPIEDHSEDYE